MFSLLTSHVLTFGCRQAWCVYLESKIRLPQIERNNANWKRCFFDGSITKLLTYFKIAFDLLNISSLVEIYRDRE